MTDPGRLLRLGLILLLGVAVAAAIQQLLGLGKTSQSGQPTWSVVRSQFHLTFRAGATDLAEAAGIRYMLTNGSVHSLGSVVGVRSRADGATVYRIAGDHGRIASVTVGRSTHALRVSIAVAPSTNVAQVTETFAAPGNEHFVGAGETGGAVDLRGTSVPVKVSYHCGSIAVPFFFSSGGFGLNMMTERIGAIGFPGSTEQACSDPGDSPCRLATGSLTLQLCLKGASLTYDVYFGTPQQVVRDHADAVGKPRMPPLSQLGLIKWRDVGDQRTVLQDVSEFHRLGIPIGWELIDNPWEAGNCLGRLQFGAPRFPHGTATIAALHARGVKVMLWVSPLVSLGDACQPLPYPSASLLGPRSAGRQAIDLTNPAARRRFIAKLSALFKLGVDGFKADRGDDIDLEQVSPTLPNEYPVLFQRAIVAAARSAGVGPFGEMVRAAASESPPLVAGVWASDQDASWDGLATAIRSAQSAGVSGFPIWGSDVGGYSSEKLFDELFVRWAQFGALSPIMEVGGSGPNSTPWKFAPQTVDLFRRAVVLHYELAPYLALLERQAAATGDPIIRPLGYAQPDEIGSWANPLELMVGTDLLAAPVDVGGFGTKATLKIGVYMPSGEWYDLFGGGAPVAGPANILRSTTLADFPLYVKAGSVVPFNLRLPGMWARPWPTNAVALPGRTGWLYAPGPGVSTVTLPGGTSLTGSTKGNSLSLRLTNGTPESQVFIPTSGAVVSVQADGGRRLPRAGSVAGLAGIPDGWASLSSPFPGVIIKLGGARTANVTVTLAA